MNTKISNCLEKSPLSVRIYTGAILVAVLVFLVIIMNGRYGKQELVKGVIRYPSYYRISTTSPGNVTEIFVKEGQQVTKGQALFKESLLSQDAKSSDNSSIREQTLDSLIKLKDKYEKEKALHDNQILKIEETRKAYLSQFSLIEKNIDSINANYSKKQKLYRTQLNELTALLKKNAINKSEVEAVNQLYLDNEMAIKKLELERTTRVLEKNEKELSLKNAELNAIQSSNLLEKRINELNNELNTLTLQQEYIVRSPVDAVIHDLIVMKGDFVDGKTPSIILKQKNNEKPEAVLYLNAQQIGFIDKKEKIFLRIDTFPYQDYGLLSASIINIADTPIIMESKESLFRVRLKIEEQDDYTRIPIHMLKDGMTLTASLRQPQQSLIQWLFFPITRAFQRNPDIFDD
ncbi:HlyD family secretion protein [Proteus mirabilis]|uniref:HlyD family secretion protein n=1 Tax=Proteus mirabilis TaxID=584 RepID=UPI000F862C00|nr:HlyD family efflux transporter periplasmic adaptor subunit [Proteus mirabilis]RUL11772.1 HlyD family efflux transporter periplasmic adaptor subunit [Proteus mirabilis]